MKLIYILPVLLVFVVGVSQAYAEEFEFEVTQSHGSLGDSLHIRGYSSTNSFPTITIIDPKGQTIFDNYQLNMVPDGRFVNIFSPNELSGIGDYTGYITHEGIRYDFEFSFVEKVDPTNPNDLPSQHDQDIERLQAQVREQIEINGQLRDRIIELERELDPGTNSELKEENLELKLENRELKDAIDNLQAIINEQIRVMLQYFS